jgi:hypothetical protein
MVGPPYVDAYDRIQDPICNRTEAAMNPDIVTTRVIPLLIVMVISLSACADKQ